MAELTSRVDQEEVDKIVETMKRKYREEGMQFNEVSGSLRELRGIIAEDTYSKADIETKEDLVDFNSQIAQKLGAIYLKLKDYLKPIQEQLKKLPLSNEIGYYLYSANMPYSANQYLALTSAAGIIALLLGFAIGLFLSTILAVSGQNLALVAILPIILALSLGLTITIIMLFIPKQKAIARGNACSLELPFALRHMATELRAGIGLYKTIQAIASTDYGELSEEFSRTITEIEEGSDTSVALKHMALRTQSKPLKTALMHIIRAMRTGGSLSNVISEIASDVSEDLKNKIAAFSQQMNFFAIIFIFSGIVLPVAIMILGAIRNSPMGSAGQDLFKAMPLSPPVMIIFYLILMPILFISMNIFIYITQPKM